MTKVALLCTIFTISSPGPVPNTTVLKQELFGCRYAPELMADRRIPWPNIFRELRWARNCGIRPFRMNETCKG